MDATILAFLLQDGLTNGAIYALLGLAIVLVFAVTRILFVPQGEFVSLGALTMAALAAGRLPGTAWLLAAAAVLAALADVPALLATPDRKRRAALARRTARRAALPLAVALATPVLAPAIAQWPHPLVWQAALTLALVTALAGPMHRLVYQPLADASVLVLLVASVALHVVLSGLMLVLFGPEGQRTPAFGERTFALAGLPVPEQTVWIFGTAVVLACALALYFGRTLHGKALRATASNRIGARLIAFAPERAARSVLSMAAFIGALSGLLIGPVVTLYYDSGFIIGLKGFVAAIAGALSSYPVTALGAAFVGVLESFASFIASPYKEIIVFTSILPILFWLSLRARHVPEDDE